MSLIFLLELVLLGASVTYAALDFKDYGEVLQRISGPLHDECNLIVGVSQEEIEDMRNGTFTENERVQRYVLCLFVVANVLSHDTNLTINVEEINNNVPKHMPNGTKMYLDCLEEAKKSGKTVPHVTVWNWNKCVYERDPERFIMF